MTIFKKYGILYTENKKKKVRKTDMTILTGGIILGVALTVWLIISKDKKERMFIIALLVITVLIFGLLLINQQNAINKLNDNCECGGHWELVEVVRFKNNYVKKFYVCSDCYDEIEIFE